MSILSSRGVIPAERGSGANKLYGQHETTAVVEGVYALLRQVTAVGSMEPNEAPDDFHSLPAEYQQALVKLTLGGPALLERCEGQSMADVAAAVHALAYPIAPRLSALHPRTQLAWGAVARFLFCLLDCEDTVSLEQVTALMVDWFKRKSSKTEVHHVCAESLRG